MKCSDFYRLYHRLHKHEKMELFAAVKAHGGEYRFNVDDDDESAPVVLGFARYDECSHDYIISRVAIDGDGYLSVYGIDKELPYAAETEIEVECGYLGYITSAIPDTEEVSDVTVPFSLEG